MVHIIPTDAWLAIDSPSPLDPAPADGPQGAEPRPRFKRALLLANPGARQVREQLDQAVELLKAGGLEIVMERKSRLKPADLIRKHRHEVDLVIVGGGDGSMNAVADALVETGLPLGILPLGTANDLARTLQIPPDVETACRIITEGHVRKIDLGWVNGKHFFNVASMGLSVRICRQLDANAKKRWGVFAYLITTIKVLWQMRPFRAVIRSGNAQWSVRSVQITVGNGRFFGGGMAVSEDATIDDQRLDLYSIEVDRVWQMLGLFWALRRGQLAHVPQVRTLQGQEFEVRTRRPRWINTDGELTVRTPATFRTIPLAVTVVAPAPSPTA